MHSPCIALGLYQGQVMCLQHPFSLRDRWMQIHRERKTKTDRDRHIYRKKDRSKQTDIQRQVDRIHRQTEAWSDRQIYILYCIVLYCIVSINFLISIDK